MSDIDHGYSIVHTLSDGTIQIECTTPGCLIIATRFFRITGGTIFLCAACNYCADLLLCNLPIAIDFNNITQSEFFIEETLEETKTISYITFTGTGHAHQLFFNWIY